MSLVWNPSDDPSVYAYFVHYGKHPSGRPGSCLYEQAEYVAASAYFVTLEMLESNTRYYFAVSSYNGNEGRCSEEVSIITAG